jgi:hypothetical protein
MLVIEGQQAIALALIWPSLTASLKFNAVCHRVNFRAGPSATIPYLTI